MRLDATMEKPMTQISKASQALYAVEGVSKSFQLSQGKHFEALKPISFEIYPGERLGLMGSSGSGKSTLALIMARLMPPTGGHLYFQGQAIENYPQKDYYRQVQLVFQHTKGVLDPFMTIEELVTEPFRIHKLGQAETWRDQAYQVLDQVGLGPIEAKKYPNQLSGGQYQRVLIARSIATKPKLLILDEPVSALDVSIQGQILNVLQALQKDHQMAYLLISHDTKVIHHLCERTIEVEGGPQ